MVLAHEESGPDCKVGQLCTHGQLHCNVQAGPWNSATRPATLTAEPILQRQLRHRVQPQACGVASMGHCARAPQRARGRVRRRT